MNPSPWSQMQSQFASDSQAPANAELYPTFADRYGQPKQATYEMANAPSAPSSPQNPWSGVTPLGQQGQF